MVARREDIPKIPLPELSQLGDIEARMHSNEYIFNPQEGRFRSEQHASAIAQFMMKT